MMLMGVRRVQPHNFVKAIEIEHDVVECLSWPVHRQRECRANRLVQILEAIYKPYITV